MSAPLALLGHGARRSQTVFSSMQTRPYGAATHVTHIERKPEFQVGGSSILVPASPLKQSLQKRASLEKKEREKV